MLNVVADKEGAGAAVLIRSCAPISGKAPYLCSYNLFGYLLSLALLSCLLCFSSIVCVLWAILCERKLFSIAYFGITLLICREPNN